MTLRGQGFYDGDAEAYTSRQLQKYFERPLRQTINEPDPEKLKGTCGTFCQALTERFAEEGIRSRVDSGEFGAGVGESFQETINVFDQMYAILISRQE